MSSSSLPRKLTKKSTIQLIVIGLLSLFIAVSAVPRYASAWPWSAPLKVPYKPAMQAIRDQGLDLEGWQVEEQIRTKIGGDAWSIQQLLSENSSAANPERVFMLLRPQIWEGDQPEVEWLDLKGSQRWNTDSRQKLSIDVSIPASENGSKRAEAVQLGTKFFRAWTPEQTYAVLQWYAWPTGGSAAPANWFWVDQRMQWTQRQRLPWVAVSVWLPIAPLSDIAAQRETAEALAQSIQSELLETVFTDSPAE